MATALVFLFANLAGMGLGLGPLLVGIISDNAARVSKEPLQLAMLCLCPGYLWVGIHLLLAARTVASDLPEGQIVGEPGIVTP